MFNGASAFSDANKGRIHITFRPLVLEIRLAGICCTGRFQFPNRNQPMVLNQADANATHGHISDWNTSAVRICPTPLTAGRHLMRISVVGM